MIRLRLLSLVFIVSCVFSVIAIGSEAVENGDNEKSGVVSGDSVYAGVMDGYALGVFKRYDDKFGYVEFNLQEIKDSAKAIKKNKIFGLEGSFVYQKSNYNVGDYIIATLLPNGYNYSVSG